MFTAVLHDSSKNGSLTSISSFYNRYKLTDIPSNKLVHGYCSSGIGLGGPYV